MIIEMKRIAKKARYTIGHMIVDGRYFCDTLEPRDRNLTELSTANDIKLAKMHGRTAIPTGKYPVVLSLSPRFVKILPEVKDVLGFLGIRIHAGNTWKDTKGCILVGFNKYVGMVINSRATLQVLMDRMKIALSHKEGIQLKIS
jgi:hypothetical protein